MVHPKRSKYLTTITDSAEHVPDTMTTGATKVLIICGVTGCFGNSMPQLQKGTLSNTIIVGFRFRAFKHLNEHFKPDCSNERLSGVRV